MFKATSHPTKSTIGRAWFLIDAKDQVLGRLATEITHKLIGKGKRHFSPHVDCGDYVVVVNAENIKIKGNTKPTQKMDFRHSGYPGGETLTPYGEFLKKRPERAIELAVYGMIPKNKLRGRQIDRLRVFKGTSHPHTAQFAAAKPTKEESK